MIDTYSKVAFAKLYDTKTALTAAEVLNDKVVPFFDEQDITISRVLTDRGTEYCGRPESHDYELYLAIENIDHSRVRRHMLWDNFQAELGEYLAHLVGLIMRRTCGVASAGFRASVV